MSVVEDTILRAENVSRIVDGFALREYKFKQLAMIQSSNSWQETYYEESNTDLTGGTGSAIEGVPRLANFPYGEVEWTQRTSHMLKHALEGKISWEDATTGNIDEVARTLLRVARGVTKSVDANIWDVLTENQTANRINSLSITAGSEWDAAAVANRDPIQNILDAIKLIEEDNYDTTGGWLLVNPKDYANLLGNANVRNAGQFFTDGVTRNGKLGTILGLNIVKSNNVTADYAAVVAGKEALTWKQAKPLTTKTIENFGIDYKIRSWEVGAAQLKNPEAVCLIDNTAA